MLVVAARNRSSRPIGVRHGEIEALLPMSVHSPQATGRMHTKGYCYDDSGMLLKGQKGGLLRVLIDM